MMRRPRRSPLFPCTTLSRSPPPAVQMQAGLAPCTWAGSLMPEETSFAVFLDRIRAGDEQAAVELVRQYEPVTRREVRLPPHAPRNTPACSHSSRLLFVLNILLTRPRREYTPLHPSLT